MNPARPRINGPKIFGVRPKHPFLYSIPASGLGPLEYSAKGLPNGLDLNPATGLITGKISKAGTWNCELAVRNAAGRDRRPFKIACGEAFCLTPPMGWNSWNAWGPELKQDQVLDSAKAMARHLKPHGWTYVNIDDSWQGRRKAGGALQPNKKFPDMAGLCRDIHSMGLKVGIYSTPWITSYAGYCGGSSDAASGAWKRASPYQRQHRLGRHHFEGADARQWAAWGIDYLKYDWLPNDIQSTKRMAQALRKSGRDIVLSLSNTAPPENAEGLAALAQCWRTTGDIIDFWDRGNLTVNQFHGIVDIWRFHNLWRRHQSPGHYNDADMLVLGKVGWGKPRPTRLTKAEQRSHFTLWVLFASPLLLGCPLDKLDPFTLSLVSNDEVIDVHQDALCAQAHAPNAFGNSGVWVKPLQDGSLAVGLFNLEKKKKTVQITWDELGIRGTRQVRDLWERRDLGKTRDRIRREVEGHGVKLLLLT